METKKMMIDSEEGFVTWCKSTESGIRLQRRWAKIILDYLSGHGRMLSTNPEGELFLNDENMTEKTTLDDVVELVCEWNYEALSDARERKENPNDFLDYCRCCTLEKTLEEHKFILERVFKQTVYGKDVQTIAHKLAMEMMKDMKLVPIYDIPIKDEIGVYNKVSEKSEYAVEEERSEELENWQVKAEDFEPKKNKEPDAYSETVQADESVQQDEPEALQEGNADPAEPTIPSENKSNSEADRTLEYIKEQGRSR